jgi:hypothetical protein
MLQLALNLLGIILGISSVVPDYGDDAQPKALATGADHSNNPFPIRIHVTIFTHLQFLDTLESQLRMNKVRISASNVRLSIK